MNLLEVNDKEQDFQFNRSEIWSERGEVDDEFEKTLLPHSREFTNKLSAFMALLS